MEGVSLDQASAEELNFVLSALAAGEHENMAWRRNTYQNLLEEAKAQPLTADFTAQQRNLRVRRLRAASRLVEVDIRAGADVFRAGYLPAGLAETFEQLESDGLEAATAAGAPSEAEIDLRSVDRLLEPREVLSVVLEGLARVQNDQIPMRRRLYDRLQELHEQALAARGVSPEGLDFHRRVLRTVIRLVETDIRAGRDVFAKGYAPDELEDFIVRLDDGRQRRTKLRKAQEERELRRRAAELDIHHVPVPLDAAETALVDDLKWRLSYLHADIQPPPPDPRWAGMSMIMPLLILQMQQIQSESKIALLWYFVGPAILLSLITALYFLAGLNYILGMDVPTFSLLGAVVWIMFRMIIFRSSTSFLSSRPLMNFNKVTPLLAAISLAILYQMIYTVVLLTLLGMGALLHLTTLTNNWMGFLGMVAAIGWCATAMGLLFGSAAVNWPFFLRFAPPPTHQRYLSWNGLRLTHGNVTANMVKALTRLRFPCRLSWQTSPLPAVSLRAAAMY